MVALDQVQGQERVVRNLCRAVAFDRVPHAYLFIGPAGSGKRTTALALAAALNCEQRPNLGCLDCHSCRRIAADNHPDLRILKRSGAAQIVTIDTIRADVITSLAVTPHEAKTRVFIAEDATALQGPAANALLKTLEEPPLRTLFILIAESAESLLPTIVSRCQRVTFLHRALKQSEDGELSDPEKERRELAQALVAAVTDGTATHAASAGLPQDRGEVVSLFSLCTDHLYRQALTAVADDDLETARVRTQQALRFLDGVAAVKNHNAHAQLVLESLLFIASPHEGLR